MQYYGVNCKEEDVKIAIKNIFNKTIINGDASSLKELVEKQGAHLQGADLRGADLRSAWLQGADLRGACLQGACLRGAYLRGAWLQGADLQGSWLQGAWLQGAWLRGAYLRGADGSKKEIEYFPVQISTEQYYVMIFDDYMQIGCESHCLTKWFGFKNKRIEKMDGDKAVQWWGNWREVLKTICKNTGRI
jgi:hypothetical protein